MTPEQRKRVEEAKAKAEKERLTQQRMDKRAKQTAETPKDSEQPRQEPAKIDVYYESRTKSFWARNARDEWQELTKENLGLILRAGWYSTYEKLSNSLSILESKLLDIIQNHSVHFAGQIAGWPTGMHTICNERVLVTRAAKLPAAKRGGLPLIRKLVTELLGDQQRYYWAWLKAGYNALREGYPFAPGQLLAIAGPVGNGKSLLQQVVTEMLGGRMGKPWDYLSGETKFNGDLIGAEHLMIEDEVGKADAKSRRFFGQKLKAILVNKQQRAEPKGKLPFMTEPFWRVTMTLNDEAESLMVLPPLDGDLSDKVILLSSRMHTPPYPSKDYPTMGDYWRALKAEVPAFLDAINRFEIPKDIRDLRFGVKAWQNPDLLHRLTQLSPESKLWTLIVQSGLLDNDVRGWAGSSVDLEKALLDQDRNGQVKELLWYPTACGVYLGRLSKSMPEYVDKEEKGHHQTIWHLAIDRT